MMLDAFGGMSAAVHDLTTAAASGGFSISEQGGQDLQNAIRGLQQEIQHAIDKQFTLSQALPMGSTPAANTFKPFFQTVAADHPQALVPALQKLYNDLDQAYNTIKQNTGATATTDQSNASNVNASGSTIH